MGLGRAFPRLARPVHTREGAPVPQESRSMNDFLLAFRASDGRFHGARGVIGIPPVWRSVTLLSGLIGALPLHAFRDRGDGPAARLVNTPPMLADPSAGHDTRITTVSTWVVDYLLDGNAMAVVASRNSAGWPTSWYPVPAAWVGVRPVLGATVYDSFGRVLSPVEYAIGDQIYSPADVLHVKGLVLPGELRGIGVLEAACKTFETARKQECQANNVADHGVPAGTIESTNPDITVAQLRQAKDLWRETAGDGAIRALAPGTKFTPISWRPDEAQMLEARQFSTQQFAMLFGLPLRYLATEVGGLTYSAPGPDGIDLLKFTVDQILVRFEQELSRHMPRGTTALFDRSAVQRTDLKTLLETLQIGLGAGIYSVPEARTILDLPVIPVESPPPPPLDQADASVLDEVDLYDAEGA